MSAVILDPDSPKDQRRLLDRLRNCGAFRGVVSQDIALDCIGDALRSLLPTPKPDEPTGLGAVVEDDRGVLWVRAERAKGIRNPWQATLDAQEPDLIRQLPYAEVAAVKVLSEGLPR